MTLENKLLLPRRLPYSAHKLVWAELVSDTAQLRSSTSRAEGEELALLPQGAPSTAPLRAWVGVL